VVRVSITVPVFFLVFFSVFPVFADTGSITVVSGRAFTIDYTSTGVKVLNAQADQSLSEILLTIQVFQNDGTLQVTLPRELIDSKNTNGTDSDFLAVVDGVLTNPQEIHTPTDRILQFTNLTTDEKEIDVIGTYLASSTTIPPTPVQPTTTLQALNQTSQTPAPQPTQSAPTPAPQPTVSSQTNVTQEKTFIQQNFDNLVSKIPYLSSFLTRSSVTDYAVIGSIVLVVVIVIASAARTRSHSLARNSKS
jgi:hypothetical protein